MSAHKYTGNDYHATDTVAVVTPRTLASMPLIQVYDEYNHCSETIHVNSHDPRVVDFVLKQHGYDPKKL